MERGTCRNKVVRVFLYVIDSTNNSIYRYVVGSRNDVEFRNFKGTGSNPREP